MWGDSKCLPSLREALIPILSSINNEVWWKQLDICVFIFFKFQILSHSINKNEFDCGSWVLVKAGILNHLWENRRWYFLNLLIQFYLQLGRPESAKFSRLQTSALEQGLLPLTGKNKQVPEHLWDSAFSLTYLVNHFYSLFILI